MDSAMMDLDEFDLETDPIKDFLLCKLKEAQSHNENLEKQVAKKKELVLEHLEHATSDSNLLKVENGWKKVHNNCFVFGFYLFNEENVHLRVSKILLNWDSSMLITYYFKMFKLSEDNNSFEYSPTNSIQKKGVALLVIEKPNFLNQISFNLNGIFIYDVAKVDHQVPIPNCTLEAVDFSNSRMEIKIQQLLSGNVEEILSLLSSNEQYELVGRFNIENKNLDTVFAVDCMFREIIIFPKKKFYLVDGASSSINGSLVEVTGETLQENAFNFKLICKNEDMMLELLHYLLKTNEGFAILPRSNILEHGGTVGQLSDSLKNEISLMQEFYQKADEKNKDDYLAFRNKLIEIQSKTDKLFTFVSLNF